MGNRLPMYGRFLCIFLIISIYIVFFRYDFCSSLPQSYTNRYAKNRTISTDNKNIQRERRWFPSSSRKYVPLSRVVSVCKLKQNAALVNRKKIVHVKNQGKDSSLRQEFDFQYGKVKSSWKGNPIERHKATDEDVVLDGEHRLRAFKKLDSAENFDISAGPELIVKEKKRNATLNKTDQPESELGVGMHFRYDF